MAFNVYTHDNDDADFKSSPIYRSCNWSISMNSLGINRSKFWPIDGKYVTEIHGIANEPVSISYSTEWGDSPGATLVSKIQEFTRASAFKMFGGTKFDPNPATNEWTQQFPKDGSYIQASLKFRAFKANESNNTTSYMVIIPWLTYMTSPLHEFSVQDELKNIGSAVSNAKHEGEKFATAMNKLMDSSNNITDNEQDISDFESLVGSIESLLTGLSTRSRGTITTEFSFGDIIVKNENIDWIITGWSFTPSIETSEGDMPLWVDFEINLETNQKLSNNNLSLIIK